MQAFHEYQGQLMEDMPVRLGAADTVALSLTLAAGNPEHAHM
jgi:hypothetical protein